MAGSALYVAAALVIVMAGLLPLGPGWVRWTGPDLLLALTFAWVLRRPDQAPVLLVAAVFLLADLLTLRPPGLRAARSVMAAVDGRPPLPAELSLLRPMSRSVVSTVTGPRWPMWLRVPSMATAAR